MEADEMGGACCTHRRDEKRATFQKTAIWLLDLKYQETKLRWLLEGQVLNSWNGVKLFTTIYFLA